MKAPRTPGLPIRPGMDVYSADQNRFIGTVIQVWPAEGREPPGSPSSRTQQAMAQGKVALHDNPPLVHEQEAQASPTAQHGEPSLGEEIGPFPTAAIGNTGPLKQSASHAFARRAGTNDGIGVFAVRPGRINVGPLSRPLYIPSTAVLGLSMERVVVDMESDEVPREWREKPRSVQRGYGPPG